MHKKIGLTMSELREQPEKTVKEKSAKALKIFGQGSFSSGVIFFIMWCITSDISFNDALRMIISGSISVVALSFFTLAKYFLSRIKNNEQILITIATKHRDAQNENADWENKYSLMLEQNTALKEVINISLKELNRAVIDLACEKQKGFVKEEILKDINEAIDNANRGCK